jgi:hypothetical protein
VPSIVVEEEVKYCRLPDRDVIIDLEGDEERGAIQRVTGDVAAVMARFDRSFSLTIDPGEAEALAVLLEAQGERPQFCTSDGPAIRALAMLGLAGLGVSFDELMESIGYSLPRSVGKQYRRDFFQSQLAVGRQNRLTGRGLADKGMF